MNKTMSVVLPGPASAPASGWTRGTTRWCPPTGCCSPGHTPWQPTWGDTTVTWWVVSENQIVAFFHIFTVLNTGTLKQNITVLFTFKMLELVCVCGYNVLCCTALPYCSCWVHLFYVINKNTNLTYFADNVTAIFSSITNWGSLVMVCVCASAVAVFWMGPMCKTSLTRIKLWVQVSDNITVAQMTN